MVCLARAVEVCGGSDVVDVPSQRYVYRPWLCLLAIFRGTRSFARWAAHRGHHWAAIEHSELLYGEVSELYGLLLLLLLLAVRTMCGSGFAAIIEIFSSVQ